MSIKVIEEEFVPYSIARRLLEQLIKSGVSSALIQRTHDYLVSVEKCNAEDAQKIVEELKKLNILKNETIAIIASICPTSIDELRSILVIEGKVLPTEDLEKILNIIFKYFKKE
jgi:DNA-directed RNA polymerase subunit F